jgi:hypothetical protein
VVQVPYFKARLVVQDLLIPTGEWSAPLGSMQASEADHSAKGRRSLAEAGHSGARDFEGNSGRATAGLVDDDVVGAGLVEVAGPDQVAALAVIGRAAADRVLGAGGLPALHVALGPDGEVRRAARGRIHVHHDPGLVTRILECIPHALPICSQLPRASGPVVDSPKGRPLAVRRCAEEKGVDNPIGASAATTA